MSHSEWFSEHLRDCPIMAILRNFPVPESIELSQRAWDLGIDHVEVPIQDQQGSDALAAVVEVGHWRGKFVGAGTVDSPEKVLQAKKLGAAYTVAPGLDEEVVQTSIDANLPHLPGVATPSEIQQALKLGLDWLKAFPATALGLNWFTAMRGPFPQAKLVATGGLNADNAQDYLDTGVVVAAVGSALQDPDQVPRLSNLISSTQAFRQRR